ncbi:MAG TPA: hypothetical protein VFD13_00855 [Candidatus Kapabacteria bacterium]|nr:hypothetical protein [Candidatus Kapabacteria bacterium]
MKRIFLFSLLVCWPALVFGQVVNPTVIQQDTDIAIHNTDVYYCPFAPPDSMDTRANLCNESDLLNDPNGVGNQWRDYLPKVGDTAVWHDTMLYRAHPCGSGRVLGGNVVWQRLVQARNKPDGTSSDIIAGGDTGDRVTISKNEDVDFRASGRIKLKSGFHVKPGAFFHAYTEPKWDTTVFSDEFDDTAKFRNQWYVGKGTQGGTNGGLPESVSDSNVYLDTDYQAHDGHALDIALHETMPDTAYDSIMTYVDSVCEPIAIIDSIPYKTFYTSGFIRSCPFPYQNSGTPLGQSAYAHAPYGKYEIRDKIPHIIHHTNNWGGPWDMEFDLNETNNETMGLVCPELYRAFHYGPFHGYFLNDTTFIGPNAGINWKNQPTGIIVNNFLYTVSVLDYNSYYKDTLFAYGTTREMGGFPISLVGDTVTFYCEFYGGHYADNVTWTVTKGADHHWDMFSAPYDTSGGVSKLFTKSYQPFQLTLSYDHAGHKKTLACHWVDTANDPVNYGKLYLDDSLTTSDLHTFTESYPYQVTVSKRQAGYPIPPVEIDNDTATYPYQGVVDTAAYAHSPYRYHTFGMEFLPHEIRYLIDSVVVRRVPDRLVPRSSPCYDWASQQARSPSVLLPSQFDINLSTSNPFAPNFDRQFFEAHVNDTGHGCWPDKYGHPAAHHLLDYVKVWDVPKDVIIPNYPH